MIGISNGVINQVICMGTINHIGIGLDSGDTDDGDLKAVEGIRYFEKERQHRNHRLHMARSAIST